MQKQVDTYQLHLGNRSKIFAFTTNRYDYFLFEIASTVRKISKNEKILSIVISSSFAFWTILLLYLKRTKTWQWSENLLQSCQTQEVFEQLSSTTRHVHGDTWKLLKFCLIVKLRNYYLICSTKVIITLGHDSKVVIFFFLFQMLIPVNCQEIGWVTGSTLALMSPLSSVEMAFPKRADVCNVLKTCS